MLFGLCHSLPIKITSKYESKVYISVFSETQPLAVETKMSTEHQISPESSPRSEESADKSGDSGISGDHAHSDHRLDSPSRHHVSHIYLHSHSDFHCYLHSVILMLQYSGRCNIGPRRVQQQYQERRVYLFRFFMKTISFHKIDLHKTLVFLCNQSQYLSTFVDVDVKIISPKSFKIIQEYSFSFKESLLLKRIFLASCSF